MSVTSNSLSSISQDTLLKLNTVSNEASNKVIVEKVDEAFKMGRNVLTGLVKNNPEVKETAELALNKAIGGSYENQLRDLNYIKMALSVFLNNPKDVIDFAMKGSNNGSYADRYKFMVNSLSILRKASNNTQFQNILTEASRVTVNNQSTSSSDTRYSQYPAQQQYNNGSSDTRYVTSPTSNNDINYQKGCDTLRSLFNKLYSAI